MFDYDRRLRDYGLPNPKPVGKPEWRLLTGAEGAKPICPHCGARVVELRVRATNPRLVGGEGWCYYLGCPACPWASPSVLRADGTREGSAELAASPWVTPDAEPVPLDLARQALKAAAEALATGEPAKAADVLADALKRLG